MSHLPKGKKKIPKWIIATQNARGLTCIDEKEELAQQMIKDSIEIVMLTETWTDSVEEEKMKTGHLLLTSGITRRQGIRGQQGVGFMLGPKAAKAYDESGRKFEMVSGRFATLRLPMRKPGRKKSTNLYMVAAYSPHTGHGPEERAVFLDSLDGLLQAKKGGEVMICGGDFNAGIGNDDKDGICGPYGQTRLDGAGKELRNILNIHNMYSPLTFCRSEYDGTWVHPRSKRSHQLDHIFMEKAERKLVRKCKISHMLVDSDHFSIRLHISLLSPAGRTKTMRQKRNGLDFQAKYGSCVSEDDILEAGKGISILPYTRNLVPHTPRNLDMNACS
jgi:exonuclease III